MRVVIALGGNAILQRGQALEAATQKSNILVAAKCIAEVAKEHQVILTHGNGPQVGLLALQNESYTEVSPYPLDVLGAETEGMIGYLLAQELRNQLKHFEVAALLTQTQVSPNDPAFLKPSKYIGPIYSKAQADTLARANQWQFKQDGNAYRRVVPSPMPQKIIEINIIKTLLAMKNLIVICAGGGGVPVIEDKQGKLSGIEAVVDKDWASCCLAEQIKADAFIMLTDVTAVETNFNDVNSRKIKRASPQLLADYEFPAGSMRPKVAAACSFVRSQNGFAAIGSLNDAKKIMDGLAGTIIDNKQKTVSLYE